MFLFIDLLFMKRKLHTIILPQVECYLRNIPTALTLPSVTTDQQTALPPSISSSDSFLLTFINIQLLRG